MGFELSNKLAGIAGAISTLSTIGSVDAAQAREAAELLAPRSYEELLKPIPNALSLIKAADELTLARERAEAEKRPKARFAQYWGWGYPAYHHHHHHHHHNFYRRWYHHHHHHHHHNFYYPYYPRW
jgi:hypothetical protein